MVFGIENDGKVLASHLGAGYRYSIGRIDSGEVLEVFSSSFPTNTSVADIVVRPNNNIIIVGSFIDSMDLVLDGSSPIPIYSNNYSCFIAEYDSNFGLVWSQHLNGTLATGVNDVELTDSSVIVYGVSSGTLDIDFGSGQSLVYSSRYIASYNHSWDLNWHRKISGITHEISSNGSDLIYLGGQSNGTVDLQTENGTIIIPTCNTFVACYNSVGNFQWYRRTVGGYFSGLDADPNGNLYLACVISDSVSFFDSTNYIGIRPVPETLRRNVGICKYAPDGGIIMANTTHSSYSGFQLYAFTVTDDAFFIGGYIDGYYDLSMDSNTNAFYGKGSGSSEDAFYAKYDGSGNLQWAGVFGHLALDYVNWIDAYDDNSVLVGGGFIYTIGTDFDPDPDVTVYSTNTNGGTKRFIANYTDCSLITSYEDEEICQGDSIEINDVFHYLDTVVLVPVQEYGQCSSSVYTEVIINPLPPASLLEDSLFLCEGDSFQLGYLEDSNITAGLLTYNGNIYVDSINTHHIGDSANVILNVESVDGCHAFDTCIILPEFLDTISILQTIISDSTIAFSTLKSSGLNNAISWDFDDGTTLTSAVDTVVHIFNNGNYLVCASGFGCNSVDFCSPISISYPPLGITQHQVQVLKVYPNPAHDMLTIDFVNTSSAEIEIVNLKGQVMYNGSINDLKQIHIDISSYPTGVFLLEILASDQIQVIPFTKS